MTAREHKSDFELTKENLNLALTGELWGVWRFWRKLTNKDNFTVNKESDIEFYYKVHQISKLKCFSSRLVVVFTLSIEARC